MMAPKGKRRALYEMMGSGEEAQTVPQRALRRQHMRGDGAAGGGVDEEGAARSASERGGGDGGGGDGGVMASSMLEPRIAPRPVRDSGSALSPGRSIRLPVGYLFFGGALVVLLMAGGYMLGYSRGEGAAEVRFASRVSSGGGAGVGGEIVEPLGGIGGSGGEDGAGAGGAGEGEGLERQRGGRDGGGAVGGREGNGGLRSPERTAGGALLVDAGSIDPREAGLNYLVVARRGVGDSVEIAEFLSARGINAGVFPSGDSGFRLVIALRGFASGTLSDLEYRRFRQTIRDLGREWAAFERGRQNFDDLYPQRYTP